MTHEQKIAWRPRKACSREGRDGAEGILGRMVLVSEGLEIRWRIMHMDSYGISLRIVIESMKRSGEHMQMWVGVWLRCSGRLKW